MPARNIADSGDFLDVALTAALTTLVADTELRQGRTFCSYTFTRPDGEAWVVCLNKIAPAKPAEK